MDTSTLLLLAPLSGVLVPLAEVPDAVFSEGLVGDGISLDPTSQSLLAPCDGKVTLVHPSAHALTLVHSSGLEVMIHIGLETVALKGDGFRPLVRAEQTVSAGQPLIEFDADAVARRARSLLTQIVLPGGDRVASLEHMRGTVTAGRDTVLRVRLKAAAQSAGVEGKSVTSEAVKVGDPLGLHARPAAVLAALARRFRCEVEMHRGAEHANAKSVVAIMTAQVQHGDSVRFVAHGPQAEEAVAELSRAVADGLGEHGAAPTPVLPSAPPGSEEPGVLRGVPASPGLAVGRIFQLRRAEAEVPEAGGDAAIERRALEHALDQARSALDVLSSTTAIFAAHRELLDDPDLTEVAAHAIASGKSAAFAWRGAYTTQAERLAALPNELLAGRANDVRDVGQRVLRILSGQSEAPMVVPEDSVLVAEELTPSDTAGLDRKRVLGFATLLGGATSHVAILARSLGMPAVAAMDARAADLATGTLVVLDGNSGTLRVDPAAAVVEEARARLREQEARRIELQARAAEAAVTKDGHAVEVAANLGGAEEAAEAVRQGAEGVGLLRSEFLFMGRTSAPTEEEQATVYGSIADALGAKRRLIVRTLDVGGDKPLPYLPIAAEENPFLGERGLRVLLARPELLRAQMRAILRVAGRCRLGIMLPMVTNLDEFRRAREIFEAERGSADVSLGMMMEVPAAALAAEAFAREADFFSIGTNDLTQYTLAVDRGHARLAPMADGLHPAVLRLIRMTVEAAHAHKRWVGVCGGVAADPAAVAILVGLGVDELSVPVPSVPAVKAAVRELTLSQCQALAEKALRASSAAEVRGLAI